jgi:hypothetical protein
MEYGIIGTLMEILGCISTINQILGSLPNC